MKTAASSTRITERIWDRWSPYREQEAGNRHKTNHTWSEIDRFDLPYPRCAAKIRITLQNGPLAQLAEQLTLNQQVQRSTRWRLTSKLYGAFDSQTNAGNAYQIEKWQPNVL